jgi:hypothetical protein
MLDVEVPPPPELTDAETTPDQLQHDESDDEYRREELETFLQEGAWAEAWEAWAAETAIGEPEFRIARDLGLFDEFDFFWDDFADRVGYHAPGLPEDWRERDLHAELDSWGAVSGINAALTELGQTVCDVLKAEYIDWEADYEAPDDLPEF